MAQAKRKPRKPSQVLGLERMALTITSCEARSKELRRRIDKGEFKGKVLETARRWASWYKAKAESLRKNGSQPASKKKPAAKKKATPAKEAPVVVAPEPEAIAPTPVPAPAAPVVEGPALPRALTELAAQLAGGDGSKKE